MMDSKDIAHILGKQVEGYLALRELLHKEREHLLEMNAEEVEELAKAKDTLLLKLRLFEAERQRLVREYAGADLTLRELAERTGDMSFLETRSKLLSLSQSIDELNQVNKMLIDRSLQYLRSTSQFLSLFGLGSGKKGMLISGEI